MVRDQKRKCPSCGSPLSDLYETDQDLVYCPNCATARQKKAVKDVIKEEVKALSDGFKDYAKNVEL